MTLLDTAALVALALLGLTVLARAELMRPRVRSSYASNFAVRGAMDIAAFACVPWGLVIWSGSEHVSPEAAGLLAACAVCSTVKLISMRVHDGRATVLGKADETRHADVAEVRAAVEETVPAAIDRAMPQLIKDLAAAPDPYSPN